MIYASFSVWNYLPIGPATALGLFFHNTATQYIGIPKSINKNAKLDSIGFWYTVNPIIKKHTIRNIIGKPINTFNIKCKKIN